MSEKNILVFVKLLLSYALIEADNIAEFID